MSMGNFEWRRVRVFFLCSIFYDSKDSWWADIFWVWVSCLHLWSLTWRFWVLGWNLDDNININCVSRKISWPAI